MRPQRTPPVLRVAWLVLLAASVSCGERLTEEQVTRAMDLGDAALQVGELEEAEGYFRKAMRAAPDNPRAASGLGLALFRRGLGDEALALFERSAALDPNDAGAAYLRAHALSWVERQDEAIAAYERLLADHPSHVQGATELMTLLVGVGRAQEAREAARAATAASPHDFGLHLRAGRLCLESSAPEDALRYFERARQIRPYSPEAVYGLVETLRRLDRIDEAGTFIPLFEELTRREEVVRALRAEAAREPRNPVPSQRYIVRLFEEGRLDEAALQTAIYLEQFPGDAQGGSLAVRAAQAAGLMGRTDAARGFLEAADSGGGRTIEERLAMAEVHLTIGESGKAMGLFESVLTESPDKPAALLGAGRAAALKGDLDRAEPLLRRAVRASPQDAAARAALGLMLAKKPDAAAKAESELNRALKLDPENADALFGLGFLAHQRRDNTGAEQHLRRALASRPDHANARAVLAMVLSDQRRCEEALPMFTEALQADYGNLSLHAGLARCYEQLGRIGEAEEVRRIARELSGQSAPPSAPKP